MSFETAILIRPTAPLSGPVDDPVAAAKDRYSRILTTQPGVVDFTFAPSTANPAVENPEDDFAKRIAPLHVTIEWTDEPAALKLFGDLRLMEYLNGEVLGRPAYRVTGQTVR